MMRKTSLRQARKLMQRMGVSVEEVPNVNEVIIRTITKEIVIEEPNVTLTRMQGQDVYQVMGGNVSEKEIAKKEEHIPEEDISMVAQQASVDMEKARKALEETKGDLAQAIILLAQRKFG